MTAIEFEHISKQYRLGLVSTKTLSHDLNRWWQMSVLGKEDPYLKITTINDRTQHAAAHAADEYVWALRDIDLRVEQGDVLGIIGRNGAGKSTLLKILSRVTAPTVGHIRVRGRIASLLEVGTGFHQEMTGRENIYLNGAIMGMTKQEITRKLDEIVAFAGCERYIDTPVKRYSSGMTVRLGFAVAAHLDPEILVVDEVLAVGDAEFQKKAIGKMQDVAHGEGRTVLFVSHNMAAVKNLCKTGIVLTNGQLTYSGTAEECVSHYLEANITSFEPHVVLQPYHHERSPLRELEILEATLLNNPQAIASDEPLRVQLHVRRNYSSIHQFQVGILINDVTDSRVGTFTAPMAEIPAGTGDEFDFVVTLNHHNLGKGRFFLDFNIGTKDLTMGTRDFDIVHRVLNFEVRYPSLAHKAKGQEYAIWSDKWGHCYFNDGYVEFVKK